METYVFNSTTSSYEYTFEREIVGLTPLAKNNSQPRLTLLVPMVNFLVMHTPTKQYLQLIFLLCVFAATRQAIPATNRNPWSKKSADRIFQRNAWRTLRPPSTKRVILGKLLQLLIWKGMKKL